MFERKTVAIAGPRQRKGRDLRESPDDRDGALRRFPYPYRAMLAVCSDLDETPDAECYLETARFLNTTRITAMGEGVGLEVGNTIYFDMPPNQFAYWNTTEAGREMVRALIRSGHIDCLHSYGDLATTRAHAGRALDELARHGCRIEVWVDHATAPTNFGPDIMHGWGDVPGSPCYHADLTCGQGVGYVWRGRVTSVIGQDRPPSWRGLFTARHPLASSRTIAKEVAKHLLARRGSEKYAMHATNALLRDIHLRDGRPVIEFIRCNPFWGSVDGADTAAGFAEVLTRRFLDRLLARGGVAILYTHLGKVNDPRRPFPEATLRAWRMLAEEVRRQRILVCTTRRLLGYEHARRRAQISVDHEGDHCRLNIDLPPDVPVSDRAGLTIYVADPRRTRLTVHHRPVEMQCNPPDETGRPSVSIPWRSLTFPDVHLR